MIVETVQENVLALTNTFSDQRRERQQRTELERVDFDRLAEAGFLGLVVPSEHGGEWNDSRSSVRPICDALRAISKVDSSLALVASMHPSVLMFWHAQAEPMGDEWSQA